MSFVSGSIPAFAVTFIVIELPASNCVIGISILFSVVTLSSLPLYIYVALTNVNSLGKVSITLILVIDAVPLFVSFKVYVTLFPSFTYFGVDVSSDTSSFATSVLYSNIFE